MFILICFYSSCAFASVELSVPITFLSLALVLLLLSLRRIHFCLSAV